LEEGENEKTDEKEMHNTAALVVAGGSWV